MHISGSQELVSPTSNLKAGLHIEYSINPRCPSLDISFLPSCLFWSWLLRPLQCTLPKAMVYQLETMPRQVCNFSLLVDQVSITKTAILLKLSTQTLLHYRPTLLAPQDKALASKVDWPSVSAANLSLNIAARV